jgi:hypothetical protein
MTVTPTPSFAGRHGAPLDVLGGRHLSHAAVTRSVHCALTTEITLTLSPTGLLGWIFFQLQRPSNGGVCGSWRTRAGCIISPGWPSEDAKSFGPPQIVVTPSTASTCGLVRTVQLLLLNTNSTS